MHARTSTVLLAAALLGAAATALPSTLGAQEEPDSLRSYRLEGLTVTALRGEAPLDLLPRRVDVVTREEIRESGATGLAELLKKTAGVDVVEFPGLLSGVGIRGFRPLYGGVNPRVLVLLDGRPAGGANLSTIDLDALERVEVVKGPASALYGSSAMGGVVNLVTRRSTGAPEGSASVRYGSFETTEVAARGGGRLLGPLDGDVSLSWLRQGDDYRVGEGGPLRELVGSDSATKLLPGGGTVRVEELGDGARRPSEHETRSGRARLGARLGGAWRADASGTWFLADDVTAPNDIFYGADGALLKDEERRGGEVGVSGEWRGVSPLLRVFTTEETSAFYSSREADRFVSFESEVRTSGAQAQASFAAGPATVVGGVDHTLAVEESRTWNGPGDRGAPFSPDAAVRSLAAFAEGRATLLDGRLTATLGGRLDRVSLELRRTPFRDDVVAGEEAFLAFSPSAGLRWAAGGGVDLHGTVGRGFVAPSAFQKAGLVVAGDPAAASVTVGNAGIDPERSLTWDAGIGLARPRAGLDADVTYFHTRVEDRITPAFASFEAGAYPVTADGTAVASLITYVNAGEATMEGVEWEVGYDLGALADFRRSLRLFAGATHLLTAEERIRSTSVDAARFAGRTDFRPEEATEAFVFGDAATRDIYNVADATVTYGVEYDDLSRFSARVAGRYVGERTDVDFTDFQNVSDIRYPAFMTLDASAALRFSERWRVAVRAINLTDENYYEKRGYSLPGRSLSVELGAEF